MENTKKALEGSDLEAVKKATEELQQAGYKIAEIAYSQQAQQGAPGADAATGAAPGAGADAGAKQNDDGTIEADYEVVEDDKAEDKKDDK